MTNQEMKVCAKEGVKKPLEKFHKDKSASDGYSSSCGECRNKVRRKTHQADDTPKVATKTVEQKEDAALRKCYIEAHKKLRQMYPKAFDAVFKKEIQKNPILIARKWRELPETEGV